MQKARKAPKATRADMWRSQITYAILFGMAIAIVLTVARLARGDGPASIVFSLFIMAIAVGLLAMHVRHKQVVHGRGLRALVEHTIGHQTSNLFRKVEAGKLLGGQGGWIDIVFLGMHEGVCYIDANKRLDAHATSSDPVLIVRDDSGTLHMFRFSDAPIGPVHDLPDGMSLPLSNQGQVGPNKFETDMFAKTLERSTP